MLTAKLTKADFRVPAPISRKSGGSHTKPEVATGKLFHTGCVSSVRRASVKTNPLTQRERLGGRRRSEVIPPAAGVTMTLKTCCIYSTGVIAILVLIAGISLDLSGVFPHIIQSLVKEVSALIFSP